MPEKRFALRLALTTLAVLVVAVVWQSVPLIQARLLAMDAEPRTVTPRGELSALERSTIDLFEQAKDSVVFITTAERVIDPWSRRTFETRRGTGSGFLWDDLGHVVTNHHVLEGASGARVRLADGRTFEASLVGSAPSNDLAVLRIGVGTDRPPAIALGDSENLQVGQSVFAIGNPFGLDFTLTTGIVSALERDLPSERGGAITGLIQTDAAINPGNSGGPLLDSAGRLIGVNTAIFSPSGSNAGIGFAVPADTVNRVVPQLIAEGRYAPPRLGVRIDPRADALARRRGIEGVLILGVEPGSPADEAGLRPARITPGGDLEVGDVIVGLGDTGIADVDDLRAALDEREAGDTVRLVLKRDDERITRELTLAPGA